MIFENAMQGKYGTDDLEELFCLDLVKSYKHNPATF